MPTGTQSAAPTPEQIAAARRRLGLGSAERSPSPLPTAAVPTPPPSTGSSGGFLSELANLGRAVVPRPARDVLGTVAQDLLSAEEALNIPGFQAGTAIREQLERVPGVGGALGVGFDVVGAPATLIPGFTGGRLAVAAGRPLGTRLGAEAATALAAAGAGGATLKGLQEAEERGLPVPGIAKTLLPLAAGVAGGVRVARRSPKIIQDLDAKLGDAAPVTRKITQALEEATPIREETLALRSQQLTKRAAEMERFTGRAGVFTEETVRARGALRAGELAKGQIEPIRPQLEQSDVNAIMQAIEEHEPIAQLVYTRERAQETMLKLIADGTLPTRSESALLEEIFGEEFFAALRTNLPRMQRLREAFFDAMGAPRALQATADISAPFRQGLLLSGRKEFWGAWKPMFRSWGSDAGALAERDILRGRPTAELRRKSGLFEGHIGKAVDVLDKEEAFRSTMVQSIPVFGSIVRASDRAYVTFLNRLRADTFDNLAAKMARSGNATRADYEKLADVVNTLTGRGRLPSSQRGMVDTLNTVFFSPRLLAARALTPIDLATAPASVRRELAGNVVSVFAAGMTGLALAKASGVADVELDPRSSDFGKGRIGNVRWDPWGGFQQIARYMAQITTGQRKSSGTGNVRDADRFQLGFDFGESKLAPLPGALLDVLRGRTFLGEEVSGTATPELSDAVLSRVTPFFLQDLNDAMREGGLMGAALGFPGAVGVGVQAFTTTADVRNEIAANVFGKPWDELTNVEKTALESAHAEDLEKVRIRSEFDDVRDEITNNARAAEADAYAGLAAGHSPRDVTNLLGDINRDRVTRMNQAFKDFGFTEQEPDDAVSRLFALRDEATQFGVTDFQLLDQLTDNALAELSPEERRQWDERQRFVHDPRVEDIFASKRLIADEGYWRAQRDAYERFEGQLRAVAPEIATYQQLEQAIRIAEVQGDRGRARRLSGVRRRIDGRTRRARLRMRRADPLLDEALILVYGLTPVRGRR